MSARFWVGQSGGGNYNSTDWALTSGGTTGQATPTSSDDVTFDGAGTFGNTNCTVTGTNGSALTLTFTSGYTATITIAATRTLSISGNFTDRPEHTWVVSSVAAGALSIIAASTITSNGQTFPGNVSFTGSNTKTLSGNWTITGALTSVSATTTINSGTLSCAGWVVSQPTVGTTVISLSGGTWSGTGAVTNSVTFAGSSTFSYTGSYSAGTITYSSGTITTTGSTLALLASCTLATNGMSWSNITVTGAATLTINSLLTATGTFTINNGIDVTFAGTAGFTVATLSILSISVRTITFANTVTYTITTAFSAFASRTGAILVLTSDHATNKAIVTLNNGATCSVLADVIRIDSSGGRTINTFHGTLTTTTNWFSYTDYGGGNVSSYVWV